MKLSKKKQQALARAVKRFESGDVGALVAVAGIGLAKGAPALGWSHRNRALACATTGGVDADCRGYRQWQEVGRQVKKDARGGFIYIPIFKRTENEDGEEEKELATFGAGTVFGYSQTEAVEDDALTYEPSEPTPLAEVAERFGVDLDHAPLAGAHGAYSPIREQIVMGSHDPYPLLHEIAHAAEARLNGEMKPGQDPAQETRAELVACVLADVYGLGDYTGNAWKYIATYNKDPANAIRAAAAAVGPILELILAPKEDL